jgi:hypothetical protein
MGAVFAPLTLVAVLILVYGEAGATGIVLALLVFAVGAFLLMAVLRKVRSDDGRAIVIDNDGLDYRRMNRRERFYVPWSEVSGVRYERLQHGGAWFVLDLRAPRSRFLVEGRSRSDRTYLELPSMEELKIRHQDLGRLIRAHLPDAGDEDARE